MFLLVVVLVLGSLGLVYYRATTAAAKAIDKVGSILPSHTLPHTLYPSHTVPCTHCTLHTPSPTHCTPHTPSLTHCTPHTPSHTLPHTLYPSHTLTHPPSHTVPLTHPHTPSLTHCTPHTPSHTLPHTLYPSHCTPHTPSLTHCTPHTPSLTHCTPHTPSLTPSLTHPPSHTVPWYTLQERGLFENPTYGGLEDLLGLKEEVWFHVHLQPSHRHLSSALSPAAATEGSPKPSSSHCDGRVNTGVWRCARLWSLWHCV